MTERENLQRLLYGDGAHANVLNALEGLDEKLVGARPANSPHSIFQILWHIIYWQEYELASITGERPSYPTHAIKSWPSETAPKDLKEWEETIQKFAAGLKRFEAMLADPAADLNRIVDSK
ncbi:MAG: DinB family protein, partial [bacterium]